MTDLRLALLQCESLPGDVDANLHRLDAACAEASASGANLLVTPEMYLTGYNIGRDAAARFAEPLPHGERTAAVAAIARRHRMAIAFGHPERDEEGSVFNTAVCIDVDGRLLGNYRKTHLFGDLDRSMFTAGAANEPPFDFQGWKVGMLICYDVEFPENTRRLALHGADLIVVPTANMEGFDFVAQHMIATRAYESQVFVAYANFCGAERGLVYGGMSCLAGPNGSLLVQGGRSTSLLMANLTRDELSAARLSLGHLEACRSRF